MNKFGLTLGRSLKNKFNSKYNRNFKSRTFATLRRAKHGKLYSSGLDNNYLPIEENIETITSHFEQQEELMKDNLISKMKRLETLREMPQCLTIKRSIKANLTNSINLKTEIKVVSRWKQLKYSTSIFWIKFFDSLREINSSLELWYSSIKTIEGNFGSGVATYFKFLRWLLLINFINCILSIIFVSTPQSIINNQKNINFNFWDIFIGNGFMKNSIFYYGSYGNNTIDNYLGFQYNIPTAYWTTMFLCYSITYILLSTKVLKSYRKCYIETSGGMRNQYASKIFSSWDYSIASLKTASRCSISIYRELKELLADTHNRENSSCFDRFKKLFIQFFITIVVIGIISGTSLLLWSLLKSQKNESQSILIAPLVVTSIMNIFPIIITQLVKIERYSSTRVTLYVNMIRIYTMTVVVVATFLTYWLLYGILNCWQTELAEEIYRLVIFDFIIFTIGNFIIEALRYKLSTISKIIKPPKFDIAQSTLNLIYNQILFLVGFYFSPPLSLIIIFKMFLTFYIKKISLMNYCEPSSTSWRAAQTHTLFLALVFLGMTGVIVTLGYIITSVKSNACGPFIDYEYTWETIVDKIFNLKKDNQFRKIITLFLKPGVGAAVLIAMSMMVYCLRAKAQSNKKMVKILRHMLVLQSKDKDFLITEFSAVADEDWLKRRTKFNENRSSAMNSPVKKDSSPNGKKNNTFIDTSSPSCSKNYVTFDISED
ncbi:transmembrane channel-like protein 5 isoform X2 [Aphidius gifuensis]|nr:transmembrane channel-like protein 5 isoform X2 [Aphidius gifuensis]